MTRLLHEMLDDLAGEAKLYDVTDRALTVSRRRRGRRRIAAAAGATTVVSVVIGLSLIRPGLQAPPGGLAPTSAAPAPPPKLPTACVQQNLPLPADTNSAGLTGGDPTGRILLGHADPETVLIWVDGQPQQTPRPPGRDAFFHDVNSRGLVVGDSMVTSGNPEIRQAWVYRDGIYTLLKGGGDTRANAINEQGVIVGSRGGRPVVWRSPDAQPQELPMHEGATSGEATNLDEDGTIIGRQEPGAPLIWAPDGTPRTLPSAGYFVTIRNGWVTGISTGNKLVRWNLRTGAMQQLASDLPGGPSIIVNALGWVVGQTREFKLRITDAESYFDLPSGAGRAVTFSDDGQTVGGIVAGKPPGSIPVVWRCK